MINFIDLFAGIGGIRRGVVNALNRYGIESQCVLSSEIDEKACETYELNYDECPQGDVRKITDVEPFDLVLAGFPCQPFSYAGKRQGFGDTRGTLFFEVERLIDAYRPKAFLLENVRGLYTHDEGRTFQTIIDHLHNLGYGTYDLLLNSSDFGVPQNRVRLYILGIRDAQPNMTLVTNLGAVDSHAYRRNLQLEMFGGQNHAVVADILEDEVDPKYICSDRFQQMLRYAVGEDLSILHGWRMMDYRGGQSVHSWDMGMRGECSDAEKRFMNLLIQNRRHPEFGRHQDGKKLTMAQIRTFYLDNDAEQVAASLISKGYLKEENGRYNPVCGNMSFEVFKFLDPDSISITLTSSDCNRLGVIQNNHARHITPRECARLQGFPDDFIVNPSDRYAYKQFGNSVSVPVIESVFADFLQNNLQELGWLDAARVDRVRIVPQVQHRPKSRCLQLNFLELFDKYAEDPIVENSLVRDDTVVEYPSTTKQPLCIDPTKNLLICNVKKDNWEGYLDGSAKIYYTGEKFPSTIALNKLYYFMPYLSGKGVRDLYLIKIARLGYRKEGQENEDKNDLRLVFEIERVGQLFEDYTNVLLEIWHTFTDTTLSKLLLKKREEKLSKMRLRPSRIHDKLMLAFGNAFDVDRFKADGVAAFVKAGFTGTDAAYSSFKEEQHQGIMVEEYIYGEAAPHTSPTPDTINDVIADVLNKLVAAGASRILIPPVNVKGVNNFDKDELVQKAIVNWLRSEQGSKIEQIMFVEEI